VFADSAGVRRSPRVATLAFCCRRMITGHFGVGNTVASSSIWLPRAMRDAAGRSMARGDGQRPYRHKQTSLTNRGSASETERGNHDDNLLGAMAGELHRVQVTCPSRVGCDGFESM